MTPEEEHYYAQLGRTMMNLVVACGRLGHQNPANTLDYVHLDYDNPVIDFTIWVARRPGWRDAKGRLEKLVVDMGLDREAAEHLGEVLRPILTDLLGKESSPGPNG